MIIQFQPNATTVQAMAALNQKHPHLSMDELMNYIIQKAADEESEPAPTKEQMLEVVDVVTNHILTHVKPGNSDNVLNHLDLCYKDNLIQREYLPQRPETNRICRWIMGELIKREPKIRVTNHVTAHSFYVGLNARS